MHRRANQLGFVDMGQMVVDKELGMQGLYAGVWCAVSHLNDFTVLNLCFHGRASKEFDLKCLQFVFLNWEVSFTFSGGRYAGRNEFSDSLVDLQVLLCLVKS